MKKKNNELVDYITSPLHHGIGGGISKKNATNWLRTIMKSKEFKDAMAIIEGGKQCTK
jgi:hypothetical protein